MNNETETDANMVNDPSGLLDERIASVVNTLIKVADPRLIVNALLGNAAALSQLILAADKATPAHVAHAFSSSLVEALQPQEGVEENQSRIQVVPAGALPFKRPN